MTIAFQSPPYSALLPEDFPVIHIVNAVFYSAHHTLEDLPVPFAGTTLALWQWNDLLQQQEEEEALLCWLLQEVLYWILLHLVVHHDLDLREAARLLRDQ